MWRGFGLRIRFAVCGTRTVTKEVGRVWVQSETIACKARRLNVPSRGPIYGSVKPTELAFREAIMLGDVVDSKIVAVLSVRVEGRNDGGMVVAVAMNHDRRGIHCGGHVLNVAFLVRGTIEGSGPNGITWAGGGVDALDLRKLESDDSVMLVGQI